MTYYILALTSFLVAVYGFHARRIVSALSLGALAAFLTSSLPVTWVEGSHLLLLALVSPLAFVSGLLFCRAAAAVSSSFMLAYTFFRLAGVSVGCEYLASLSLVLMLLTYLASRRRGYIPFVALGSSAFAYFASFLTHVAIAVPLAVSIGIIGLLLQERTWKTRVKYEKMRFNLKKRRSIPRKPGSLRSSQGSEKVKTRSS